MQDGNASIESLGRLTVVHPQIKHSTALSETQVFFLTDDVTMIWDASRNQASVWLTDGIPDICDVSQFYAYLPSYMRPLNIRFFYKGLHHLKLRHIYHL